MTFNATSRLRSLDDRSAALGSSRCKLPGMYSVLKSAVLPYASGVGGLSRRLLNNSNFYKILLIFINFQYISKYGILCGQSRSFLFPRMRKILDI